MNTLKNTLKTISANSLIDYIIGFVLRLEPVYSAMLAVLTSAVVSLCSFKMNCFTKYALIDFVGCVFLLILLLSQSKLYNERILIMLKQHEDSPYTRALRVIMEAYHKGKEKLWKWIIMISFGGLLACTYLFSANSLKSINYELDESQSGYQKPMAGLQSTIDSLHAAHKTDIDMLKEIRLSLEEMEKLQKEQSESISRLRMQMEAIGNQKR